MEQVMTTHNNLPLLTRSFIADENEELIAYIFSGEFGFDAWFELFSKHLFPKDGVCFTRLLATDITKENIELIVACDTIDHANLVFEFSREDVFLKSQADLLKDHGFRFCLIDPEINRHTKETLMIADFIKIDVKKIGIEKIKIVGKFLSSIPAKLILHNVSSRDEQRASVGTDFTACQGTWLTDVSRVVSIGEPLAAYSAIFSILETIKKNGSGREIEKVLKADPPTSIKLFRYINSVGFGAGSKISSFSHAINLLGYDKLYKWCTLLLLSARRGPGIDALIRLTVIRGKILESLGIGHLSSSNVDKLFLIGVFSLLPSILNANIQHILNELNVDKDIEAALLFGTGPFSKYLELVKALEENHPHTVLTLANELKLGIDLINRVQMDAIKWVEAFEF